MCTISAGDANCALAIDKGGYPSLLKGSGSCSTEYSSTQSDKKRASAQLSLALAARNADGQGHLSDAKAIRRGPFAVSSIVGIG